MLLKIIITDLKRVFSSKWFLLSVIGCFGLCLCAIIGLDEKTNDNIFVFSMIGKKGLEKLGPEYGAFEVFLRGIATWFPVYAPVIISFSFVPLLLEERNSRATILYITRQSRIKYLVGNAVTSVIAGGVSMLSGFLLYGIVVFFSFPHMDTVIHTGKPVIIVLKCMACIFAYSAFFSLFTLAVSVFTDNIYIVLCIPFFIDYSYNQIYLSFVEKSASRAGGITPVRQWIIENCLPRNILMLYENPKPKLWLPLILITVALIFVLVYMLLSRKKVEVCG